METTLPCLIFRDASGGQHVEQLEGDRMTIGRGEDNPISLPWDPQVSSVHAELERLGGEWTVSDEGLSRNGTFLNGRRISGRARLRDGDTVRIGRSTLVYRVPTGTLTTIATNEERESQEQAIRASAAPDGTVTLLFTDIEDSTAINERLGDRHWIEVLGSHDNLIREAIGEHEGFEVKSQGDGFMVAFSSSRRALRCAIAIQRGFRDAEWPAGRISVGIGIHTGEVILQEGDFFGRHVNLAARIASRAAGGEILASTLVKELTAGSGEFSFGAPEEVTLRGLTGSHEIYPVSW